MAPTTWARDGGDSLSTVKAHRVSPGDHVGVISPSWGGAAEFPHRVELGVRQLHRLGLHVKFGRHALNSSGFVSDTPEHRAADVHELFLDPEVRMILAAIGGDRTRPYSFPVVTDMDFGHTAPQMTMPIGCRARVDTATETFEIVEAAVE